MQKREREKKKQRQQKNSKVKNVQYSFNSCKVGQVYNVHEIRFYIHIKYVRTYNTPSYIFRYILYVQSMRYICVSVKWCNDSMGWLPACSRGECSLSGEGAQLISINKNPYCSWPIVTHSFYRLEVCLAHAYRDIRRASFSMIIFAKTVRVIDFCIVFGSNQNVLWHDQLFSVFFFLFLLCSHQAEFLHRQVMP